MGKSGGLSRREVLKLGAVGATAMGVVGGRSMEAAGATPVLPADLRSAGTDAGGYEVLANANGFGIDIPGASRSSKNAIRVDVDELTVDDSDRLAPSTALLTFGFDPLARQELQAWVDEGSKGQVRPRSIALAIFRRDGSAGRSCLLVDCQPVEWGPVAFDSDTNLLTETLRVKVGRIEFKT